MGKKNVLIVIGGYLPAKGYGGGMTSTVNFVENLGDQYNIFILCNDCDYKTTNKLEGISDGWNTVGKAKVMYINSSSYSVKFYKKIIEEINADLVYMSSLFYFKMNFTAIVAAKKKKVPIVLLVRGELNKKALTIKSFRKKVYIYAIKLFGLLKGITFQATCDEEYHAIKKYLGIKDDKIYLLPNLPKGFKSCKNKSEKTNRFVYVSRIHEIKNLAFVLECLKEVKNDVYFDIYGPIEQKEYWEKCEKIISELPKNVSVEYKGNAKLEEVSEIFANHYCFLCSTFGENYGQAIHEALLSNCHIILSKDTTPWNHLDNNGCFVIPLSDKKKWIEKIEYIASLDESEKQKLDAQLNDYITNTLCDNKIIHNYYDMIDKVIKES